MKKIIDISVQRYYDDSEAHRILLNADIIIVEGLNLSCATQDQYELICLPLKLAGSEGAPARVVLINSD